MAELLRHRRIVRCSAYWNPICGGYAHREHALESHGRLDQRFWDADRGSFSQRLDYLRHHECSLALALADFDRARDVRFRRACIRCKRNPPRSSPNVLPAGLGRLALVCAIAVQRLRYTHDDRTLLAND